MIDVKQEIIKALDSRFGLPVTGENTEQNFSLGSFYVMDLMDTHTKQVGDYHQTRYSFNIHYYAKSDRPNRECREMKTELVKLFRFFEPLRLWPERMTDDTTDGVLQFVVDFKIRYKVIIGEDPVLNDLEIRSDLVE